MVWLIWVLAALAGFYLFGLALAALFPSIRREMNWEGWLRVRRLPSGIWVVEEYFERWNGNDYWAKIALAPNEDNAVNIANTRFERIQYEIDNEIEVPHGGMPEIAVRKQLEQENDRT